VTDTPGRPSRADCLGLLRRNPNFRRLWIGQVVSLLGDWFNLVASSTLIHTLTGSGAAVGSLFAIRSLAPFVVSPVAGVAADRYDRRRLLIVTDLLRAAVVLGFLLVDEPGDVWLLYALTFVQLALSGFFFPAHRALLPDLVDRADLGVANTLGSATWSMMLAFGAALGGVVAGRFGVSASFVIDAATFVVSAWFLWRMELPATHAAPKGGGLRTALGEYAEGIRYLRANADVALVASHKAVNTLLVAGGFQVVQVALCEHVFVIGKDGGTGLGLTWSAVGVGTGLGPVIARRWTGDDDRRMRTALTLSYVASAAGLVVVAVATAFPLVLLGCLLRGVGAGLGWVFSTQMLLHLVPGRFRGRVFSTEFAALTLVGAIGSAAAGWALDLPEVGIAGLLGSMATLVLVPALLWSLWCRRAAHDAPRP
jgi:MFS family permease